MIIISNDKPQLNRRIRKAFNVNRPHAFWSISRSLTIGSNIMLLICVRGLVVICNFSIFTLLPRVHHVRLLYCTFYTMKRTRHQFNPIQSNSLRLKTKDFKHIKCQNPFAVGETILDHTNNIPTPKITYILKILYFKNLSEKRGNYKIHYFRKWNQGFNWKLK